MAGLKPQIVLNVWCILDACIAGSVWITCCKGIFCLNDLCDVDVGEGMIVKRKLMLL